MRKTRQASLVTRLVRPIVKALVRTGLTQREILGGAIEHTEMLWETPPLQCEAMLDGVPLHMHFEGAAPYVVSENVYAFWSEALIFMRIQPFRVINNETWRNLSSVMPKAAPGERAFWIAPPKGLPSRLDNYAGVSLSLECANLLRHTTAVKEVVSTDDDFYVVTAEGREVGVREGLPIVHADQWDLPAAGLVQDMLRMPRGEPFIGCDYDLLSKLRSLLHVRKSKVPDFEGVDWALQALRVRANGTNLPELALAIKAFRVHQVTNKHRLRLLGDVVELAGAFGISDRARITAIRSFLVPEVMTASDFKKRIFSSEKIPAALTERARSHLQQGVQALLDEELSRAD